MNIKALMDIKRQINKPEYWFNPQQLLRRLQYKNQGETHVIIPLGAKQIDFSLNENEVIGRSILTMGVYDLIVAESMKRLLNPDDLFVDVGANIGYFTRLALEYKARTLSFEPHPRIYERLTFNTKEFPQAETHPFALSTERGKFELYIPKDFSGNEGIASLEPIEHSDKIQVKTETLDSLISEQVRFLKVDVEGHESQVFLGAKETLLNRKVDYILFEDFNGDNSQAKSILKDYGYRVFGVLKTPLGPKLLKENQFHLQPSYEPPNFIATTKSDELQSAFLKKGWQFYS